MPPRLALRPLESLRRPGSSRRSRRDHEDEAAKADEPIEAAQRKFEAEARAADALARDIDRLTVAPVHVQAAAVRDRADFFSTVVMGAMTRAHADHERAKAAKAATAATAHSATSTRIFFRP